MGEKKKKIVKSIKIDVDKCNGCRACEVACSAFHATPKYSSNNPARSRIRLIRDPLRDMYLPVYAGEYAPAECMGRDKYVIDGKEYDECGFLQGFLPFKGCFQGTRFQTPPQMRHVRGRSGTRKALVCSVVHQ